MKNPYIGQMDTKIEVFAKQESQNEIGEGSIVEVLLCSPFAKVEEQGGDELLDGKVLHKTMRQYTFRYIPSVNQQRNKLIVKDGGQKFEVMHQQVIGRKAYITLKCITYE